MTRVTIEGVTISTNLLGIINTNLSSIKFINFENCSVVDNFYQNSDVVHLDFTGVTHIDLFQLDISRLMKKNWLHRNVFFTIEHTNIKGINVNLVIAKYYYNLKSTMISSPKSPITYSICTSVTADYIQQKTKMNNLQSFQSHLDFKKNSELFFSLRVALLVIVALITQHFIMENCNNEKRKDGFCSNHH